MTNPATALSCMFPPREGLRGACTTIADLRWARPRPLWGGKREAVRLIVAAAMTSACAYGHGNKAARREAVVRSLVVAPARQRPHFESYQPMKKRVNIHE